MNPATRLAQATFGDLGLLRKPLRVTALVKDGREGVLLVRVGWL